MRSPTYQLRMHQELLNHLNTEGAENVRQHLELHYLGHTLPPIIKGRPPSKPKPHKEATNLYNDKRTPLREPNLP